MGTVMRISTFWFCMKQGLVNICRNIWFSLASTAIISACIFLFCVFFSVITNMAAGILDQPLTDEEVNEVGHLVADNFSAYLKKVLARM